jgi:prepilin-type processing-associated H-X9-DG protein
LPPAATWGDAILPYLNDNEWYFVCPSAPDLACGYAYNEAYSEKRLEEIPTPGEALLLFDSDPGEWNNHQAGADLPPAGRHRGPINAGYVDGHTMMLKAPDPQGGPK